MIFQIVVTLSVKILTFVSFSRQFRFLRTDSLFNVIVFYIYMYMSCQKYCTTNALMQ